MWRNRIPYQTSDDLDVVHRGEVLPPLRNHKLDHNIAARLFHCYRLTLSLPAVMGQLARLPDHLEAVAICRLAAFNRDLFDSSGDKANFIDDLRLLELNCQLLREHAGRQPIWVIVSMNITRATSQYNFLICFFFTYSRAFAGSNLSSKLVAQEISIIIFH